VTSVRLFVRLYVCLSVLSEKPGNVGKFLQISEGNVGDFSRKQGDASELSAGEIFSGKIAQKFS